MTLAGSEISGNTLSNRFSREAAGVQDESPALGTGLLENSCNKGLADFQHTQQAQRQFSELLYPADSWEHPRPMIAKVEVTDLGLNRPFVVTNRGDLSAR